MNMIQFAAVTSIGICNKNDDRIMINGDIIADGTLDGIADSEMLATVCDGVGGYDYGDEAATITSRIFTELSGKALRKEMLEAAIADANAEVLLLQQIDSNHRNMSTTIAGVYINNSDIIVFNVGDTKVFRFRNCYLTQLSVDHTFTQESIDLGLVRSRDEIDKKDRHRITRCIGDKMRCRPSILVAENRVFEDDVFLICSDGLSDVVSNGAIEKILNKKMDLPTRCKTLLEASLQNESQDNISIILLEVK